MNSLQKLIIFIPPIKKDNNINTLKGIYKKVTTLGSIWKETVFKKDA